MSGKEKCKLLKKLRQRIAEENNIEYTEKPCSFEGDCKGTCPACDKELRELTQKVNKLGLGMTAAVGISLFSLGLSGCTSDGSSPFNNGQALGGETTVCDNELSSEEETTDGSSASADESKGPEALETTDNMDIYVTSGDIIIE